MEIVGIMPVAGLPVLRSHPTVWAMDEKQRVLAANNAFYEAFREADFEGMERLWSTQKKVSVYHPNWPGIDTRDGVMESWYRILISGNPPKITASDATVVMTAKTAMVICREHLGGTELIATNIFVLEEGEWRMTNHQSSRLPVQAEQDEKARRRED